MAYSSKVTYPIYDLNSTEFMEVVRELLQVEMLNQRTTHGKTFLPQVVKKDEYLLNPIADKEMNPAFCAIIKAKTEGTDQNISNQQNDLTYYIISIMANGLENLRKIADSIYIILNDMDVKSYLYLYKNASGDNLIYDSEKYKVNSMSAEIEEKKTMNDKNIIYGNVILQAQIVEVPKENTHPAVEGVNVNLQAGPNKKEIKFNTDV